MENANVKSAPASDAEVADAVVRTHAKVPAGPSAPASTPQSAYPGILAITNCPPIYTSVAELRRNFGRFGGRYIPETLMAAHEELERVYVACTADPVFRVELETLGRDFVGRPTPMYHAARLSAALGGGQIWLKREELAHTGSHKLNNALGQALVAKRIGKSRVIAETGAGQHGVATATACALLGLTCVVYMGEEDVRRQALNVFRMKMLGARVVPVTSGSRTLKVRNPMRSRDAVCANHRCIVPPDYQASTTHHLNVYRMQSTRRCVIGSPTYATRTISLEQRQVRINDTAVNDAPSLQLPQRTHDTRSALDPPHPPRRRATSVPYHRSGPASCHRARGARTGEANRRVAALGG